MPYYQPPQTQQKDPYQATNAMAPPNPWQQQPQPRSTAGAMTTQRNAFSPPAGFDVRAGSENIATNQAAYGQNYFPGTVPGYSNITNPTSFYAQTPEQQGDYRQALYGYNQRQQLMNPGQQFQYDQQAYQQNPAYQSQLQESERALNRHLLHTGRSDSSGAANAFATNARRLGGEFEQQAYGRAGDEYERQFRQNEQLYGRAVAEQILQQQQDQQMWERNWTLANAGFQPGPQ